MANEKLIGGDGVALEAAVPFPCGTMAGSREVSTHAPYLVVKRSTGNGTGGSRQPSLS